MITARWWRRTTFQACRCGGHPFTRRSPRPFSSTATTPSAPAMAKITGTGSRSRITGMLIGLIRRLHRKENGGTARALDAALEASDEDTAYYTVAASDDFCHPSWEERRIKTLESLPPQVALVYDNYMMVTDFAMNLQGWRPVLGRDAKPIMRPNVIPIMLRPYDYRALVETNYIPGVSLWRASVYEKIPKTFLFDGYDTECARHGEDYWHWLQITDYWDAYWIDTAPTP